MAVYIFKKSRCLNRCGGVVVAHLLMSMVRFCVKIFITCPVECMNSYNIRIHIDDEFSMNSYIFCSLNIWIHTNMNSYYVGIHIFFAVFMYEFIYLLQCKIKAASARKPQACAASAQREMWARSVSCEGEARANLLPRPGHARRPRPLGFRAAAPIVRVACGCPDS